MKKTKTFKVSVALLIICVMLFSVLGCSKNEEPAATEKKEEAKPVKIALELTTAGLGDKNFNDMGYEALKKAKEDFGIEFDYAEPKSVSDYETQLRDFAESEEYDLIVALGFDMADALKATAEEFTDQKFLVIDPIVEMPNVCSITTRFEDQTFLTGVIAGLLTTDDRMPLANADNAIGVVLGMDNPTLRAGVAGYMAGAKFVNPDVEVMTATAGSFSDPAKGKEMTLSMYDRGADAVLHIAGATGIGVFNAAKEADKYAFGIGGNQNYIDPDRIVATALRNVDQLIYEQIKKVVEGTWEAGAFNWGIKENAVGYDVSQSNVELPQDVIDKVEDIKAKVIAGELTPPATLEEVDEWVKTNQYK